MKRLFPLILIGLIVSSTALSQMKPTFPDLTYKNLGYPSYTFGYMPSNFNLEYKKLGLDSPIPDGEVTKLGSYQASSSTTLTLYFTTGASDDPELFMFDQNGKRIFSVGGEGFHFKGRILYVSGSSNHMFDQRRKFVYKDGTYKEVPQPYYYVGKKGKLKRAIKLYETKAMKNVVATLPKGYDIEIVMAEFEGEEYMPKDQYLVKTKFGLVGWIKIGQEDYFGGLIPSLYMMGD
ncbi:MAG: hypothetical protein AAFY71_12335 [Bacteroidota bacterium]